ncbi:MAG: LCP family protein [Clostridia bacterium]|nr:LCP family protein [Clostridia bacterium]
MSEKKRRSGGFEDISSYSAPKGFKNKLKYFKDFKLKPFFLRNKKRNLKAILSVVICLVLVFSAVGGAYVRKIFSLINYNEGHQGNPDATFATEYEEDISFETIYDIEGAENLKDLLKSWATNNGEKLYSKNVINVLLIGEDNEDGSSRSDSTMLVSVNTKTKKITICSFLRDSYTYMDINGSERYDKTNHSYSWGGPAKLMEVLSNNYKIKIDHYVSINYESFIAAVDALGGIAVPVTEAEASYMNRTTKIKGFESGENVVLDGQHALVYARIRYLDSEVERTRRQRELISSLIENVKSSSLSDLNNAFQTFLPYVTTNFSTSEILSLGTKAISDGWLKFDVTSTVMPAEDFRMSAKGFRTYTGYLDVWIVDYIKAARNLQLLLFEKTNIEINPDTHVSALDMVNGNYSSQNAYNEYEDETTTRRNNFWEWSNNGDNDEDETTTRRPLFDYPSFGNDETTTEEDTSDYYYEEDTSEEETDYVEETTEETYY